MPKHASAGNLVARSRISSTEVLVTLEKGDEGDFDVGDMFVDSAVHEALGIRF